jgi:putative phosphoribosyl transferase
MHQLIFENRSEAGAMLAEKLEEFRGSDAIVLAVPRGGIPVGYEIAKRLFLPLDLILAKKIGHPQNPEFAIGSVSIESVVADKYMDITDEYIKKETERIRVQLLEKAMYYDEARPHLDVKGKTAILTDDGIATGNTLLVTTKLLRRQGYEKIVVAVPVLPLEKVETIGESIDRLEYVLAPRYFVGVGAFYENFQQVSDEEAKKMMQEINQSKRIKNTNHEGHRKS